MAKTGFWLKGATGKLAGTTMYKDPTTGETIMREIVSPSNPKTQAQMVQRIIMHTIASAYSLTKELTDHSFEGKKAGRETMSYFMQQNIQFCRQKIADMLAEGLNYYDIFNFLPLGIKGFVPNQYQLSMGSLPRVDASIYRKNLDGVNVTNYGLIQGAGNTYQSVINTFGLQRGDQLTFLTVESVSRTDSIFKFARVILDPTDPETFAPLPLSTPLFGEDGKINAPSVRNEGDFRFAAETNGVTFHPAVMKYAGGIAACAVIVSRKVGDKWNRSTAYLTYREGASAGDSLGNCLDAAVSGAAVNLYTPNSQYLNNAGEGGGQAAASGEGSETPVDPSNPNQPSVESVAVNAEDCIAGTMKTLVLPEGQSFPYNVDVQVDTANADGGKVVVYNGSGTKVAEETIESDIAIVTVAAALGAVYTIKLAVGGSEIATGYSFEVASNGEDED